MMIGRLWNFAKRHKKKFFFGTVFCGGAYAAWQFLLPRLQDRLMQKLLRDLEKASAEDAAEAAEERRRQRFQHKQQVSDAHARRKLSALRARQNSSFDVEGCKLRVTQAKSKEQKLEAFTTLQVECLAKAASALLSLQLLLLLHRVGFNISGRELAEGSDAGAAGAEDSKADEDAHAVFLEALDHVQGQSFEKIASAVRTSMRNSMERANLAPTAAVTREALEKLFVDGCRGAAAELVGQSRGAALLLPDSLDDRAAKEHQAVAKRLLDEARDYLDSPQVVQVLQVCASEGAALLAAALAAELAAGAGVASGSGADAGPWPLAKFNGPLTKLAGCMLEDVAGDGAPAEEQAAPLGASLVQQFAKQPRVEELCRGLYFQGAPAAAS